MGVFKCDTDALDNKVNLNLKNGKNSLDDGANILASISIPSSFSLSESLASAPSKIRNNGEKISSLQKWVTDVVEKFTGAEKANNAAINSLTSNISKMDLSVGIGAGLTIDSNNNFLVTLEEKFKNIIDEFLDNNKKEESTNADIVEDYETPFSLIDTIKNEIDSISETIDEIPILSNVIDLTKTVVCSTFISVTSAWKGILELLGSLIDTITLLGAAVISILTLIADCIYYLASDSSPTLDRFVDYMDNYSATTTMLKGVMGFVATTYVENAWNDFYEKSFIGQKLDENAVEIFKHDGLGCDILSGIGYISGIVIITILTMGVAGAGAGASAGAGTAVSATVSTSTSTILSSVIAASSAFGKYTGESWAADREASWEGIEEAFKRGDISKADYESMKKIRDLTDEEWNAINDEYLAGNITLEQMQLMEQIREMPADWRTGENLESGLAYGGLNAIWEGAQWLVGGFLGKITAGLGKVGAAIRVSVDSIFNTMDTPFRSLITASTEGRDFGEVFEEKGGWLSVLSDFSIGLIGSAGGEIFDSIKTFNINRIEAENINRLDDLCRLKGLNGLTTDMVKDTILNNIGDIHIYSDTQLNILIENVIKNNDYAIKVKIDDYIRNIVSKQNIDSNTSKKIEWSLRVVANSKLLIGAKTENIDNVLDMLMRDIKNSKVNLGSSDINVDINLIYDYIYTYGSDYVFDGLKNNKISDIAKFLYDYTSIGNNAEFYRSTQFELVEKLKGELGEEEAVNRVTRLFEEIIYTQRGGEEKIATIDGVNIYALKNSNPQELNKIFKEVNLWIKNLPDKLKANVKDIYMYDVYNTADVYWQKEYQIDQFCSAMKGGNGKIRIYAHGDKFSSFIHESGHCFDSVYNVSNSKEWIDSMNLDQQFNKNKTIGVTDYATSAYMASGTKGEDFAESVMLYIINPDEFKARFPNRWKVLNKYL